MKSAVFLTAFIWDSRVSWHQNSREHWPAIPPSLSSNFSQALSTFPPSIPLGSNTKETCGNSYKKHKEPEDKNLHFLYTRLILDLTRPFINCWSPLTHTSNCTTTSRPAAATQRTARVSAACKLSVTYCVSYVCIPDQILSWQKIWTIM